MSSATGVCENDVHRGAVDAEVCPVDPVYVPESSPAVHAAEVGKADSLFDQLMKEAQQQKQKRKPQTSTHPAFVVGRISREAYDALIGGFAGLGRYLRQGMSAADKALLIGFSGAQAQEDLRSEMDAQATDEQNRVEPSGSRREATNAILAAAGQAEKSNGEASTVHASLKLKDLQNKQGKVEPIVGPDQPSREALPERKDEQVAESKQAPSEAQTCEAGGDCIKGRHLHWKLHASTPGAFWARAVELGLSKEWFKGKAIVFIEPERDASAAMKLAASVRWKEGDRILDMLDPWSLKEAKKAGFDICGTPHSLPGKDCIGIADPAIVKRRSDQIVRVVEALKTGIKMLARILPQDESWMSRHRAISKTAAHELAALFGSQVEAVNKMLETHLIRQADADALRKVRSDIIRENEALDRINAETFPDLIRYAWEQLEQHRASRAGTDRTDLIVLGPDAGRNFIAENRDKDVVIVELEGQQQRQSNAESVLPDMGVPPFRKMRIA